MRTAMLAVLLAAAACADGVPLAVVEEHSAAFPLWQRAREEGRLSPGAAVVHFDAHEDMGVPEGDGEASVDEVIVPAILAGTVDGYLWVVPPWLDEQPRAGISEVGGRRYWFSVTPLDEAAPPAGPWILDVDLDFFACENPHAEHTDTAIDRTEYERLLAAGEVRFHGENRQGSVVTESTVLRRPPGPFTWPARLDRVRDDATGEERYVRGYMCMGEYRDAFPVHRPDDEALAALLSAFERALTRFPHPPALITVSRSATSGFVPADRVDEIERRVLPILRRAFD